MNGKKVSKGENVTIIHYYSLSALWDDVVCFETVVALKNKNISDSLSVSRTGGNFARNINMKINRFSHGVERAKLEVGKV